MRCFTLQFLLLLLAVGAARAQAPVPLPDLTDYRVRVPFNDPYEKVQAPSIPLPAGTEYPASEPRLRVLMDSTIRHQAERFRSAASATAEMHGYRIQIYSGNNVGAQQSRVNFMAAYPMIDVYTMYDRPLFKVRVGNYISQKEAEKFCKELKIQFPSSFVVPETVQISR